MPLPLKALYSLPGRNAEKPSQLQLDLGLWALVGGIELMAYKGTTEDEMVGWHHRLNGHEFVHGIF